MNRVQFSRSQRKTVLPRIRRIMMQPLFSYITIELAPVVFLCCTSDRDGYSHRLIFFTRPFYLLENIVIFSTKAYWIFWHSCSYWALATVLLTSLSTAGKWLKTSYFRGNANQSWYLRKQLFRSPGFQVEMTNKQKNLNLPGWHVWLVKVARSYLYASWLCFWFAFFRMKDSTDLYDFLHP